MFDIMTNAKNAIEAYTEALTISSNNIANLSTPGYKKIGISFQSIYERMLSGGTAASTDLGGTNPQQLGQSMTVANIGIDFTSGDTVQAAAIDLAISGSGLFIVSTDGGNSFLYSRAGNFQIDANGNLVTSNGMQVYGLDNAGNITAISNLPSGNTANYRWQSDGTLQYSTDGTNYTNTGYKIALTYFANPGGLAQSQGNAYAATLASGTAADAQAPGGAVGSILVGQTENSNVDYYAETIKVAEIQRNLSANLSMVKAASDAISNFIQKLG